MASFISIREAARQLKEAGISYTRPTLKTTLYAAMKNNKEYSTLVIRTGAKSWMKVNSELLSKWTEDTFNVKIKKEITKEERKQ